MIRKSVIVMLTLAAVATAVVWPLSYRLDEERYRADLARFRESEARGVDSYVYPWDHFGLRATVKLGQHGSLSINAEKGALRLMYRRDYPWTQAGSLDRQSPPVSERRYYPVPGLWYSQYSVVSDWEAKIYYAILSGDLALADKLASGRPSIERWATGRRLTCYFWLLLLIFSAYPAVVFVRGPLRRWWRRERGLCLNCGYNLTGNVTGVCSECGERLMPPGSDRVPVSAQSCARRLAVRVTLLAVGAVTVVWLLVQVVGPYTSMKNRVIWQVGTDRLQTWAIDVLRSPPPPLGYGPWGSEGDEIDTSRFPEDIRRLVSHGFVYINQASNEEQEHVHLFYFTGSHSYGLKIGTPDFEPAPKSRCRPEELADGVWGYYER